jgi:uncharacterized protein (DUF433 family)
LFGARFTHVVFDNESKIGESPWTVPRSDLLSKIEEQQKEERKFIMSIPLDPIQVPLFWDDYQSLRVVGTRVHLESIIQAWNEDRTPKQIVQDYDTLKLSAVLQILGWYLDHQEQVDEYLKHQAEKAEEFRAQIEAFQPDQGSLKAKLLAKAKGVAHAAPADG